ncbi:MAG: hypothetical protein MN733_16695, partial [Nitrososphaera sp.]|nr:hypothetical protein [Nitrososphaera sp.]
MTILDSPLSLLAISQLSESEIINELIENWKDLNYRKILIEKASLILNDKFLPIKLAIDFAEHINQNS